MPSRGSCLVCHGTGKLYGNLGNGYPLAGEYRLCPYPYCDSRLGTLIPGLNDLTDMPDWNPSTGGHALRSVSEGRVYWDDQNKVCCINHRAMNAVNEDCTIWRCLAFGCQTGAYVTWA